jgi:hypothetical protein
MGWTVQGSIPGSDSDFNLLQNVHTGSGTNPFSYSGDTWSVPQSWQEADNSHLSTSKGKNEQSHMSAPLYAFMAWTEIAVPLAFRTWVKSVVEWINHDQSNCDFVFTVVTENSKSSLGNIVSYFRAST